MDAKFLSESHRRWNPLKRAWVLVSPQRTQRPWQGEVEPPAGAPLLQYDPACYLCPGNTRAGGRVNPVYPATFVFDNDFAALQPDAPPARFDPGSAGLLRAETERGICRVVCFSPRHDLTLATLHPQAILAVVDAWADQAEELSSRPGIAYVQIFENRGAMMGASNPHPHSQIWATEHIPNEPLDELDSQRVHLAAKGTTLLGDYLALELDQRQRIVCENEGWVALVPFWAVWPFEILLLPRERAATLAELAAPQREALARILHTLTQAYDRVFNTPFPYSMGLHPAPVDGEPHPEWDLHIHFYPPLLRSATIRKFMVGFELLGSPQRDITPESAAETLRKAVGEG